MRKMYTFAWRMQSHDASLDKSGIIAEKSVRNRFTAARGVPSQGVQSHELYIRRWCAFARGLHVQGACLRKSDAVARAMPSCEVCIRKERCLRNSNAFKCAMPPK